MDKKTIKKAFEAVDAKLDAALNLLVGGGAAMLLGHGIPLSTHDVDGLPLDSKISAAKFDVIAKEVAKDLGISAQWYNDYFNSFTYTLPADFRDRLKEVYRGKKLVVKVLGAEDLLIMKCMAGREKDIGHARALIRRGANLQMVERHLEELARKGIVRAKDAVLFLEDLMMEIEDA